jgi:gluconate 2-dehydrogenase subunit 3-like protein
MKRGKVSRRRFVRGSIRLAVVSPLIQLTPLDALGQSNSLGTAERRTLRAAADVIIPADRRMPSAISVGANRYIERIAGRDARLAGLLGDGLRAIDTHAMATHASRFDLLTAEQQAEVLVHIEKTDAPAGFFPALRDLVYEAYYTQPQVMKLLGYNFRSGRRRTAPLDAFDEQRLARVRRMPPFYRQVKP